MKVAIIGTHGIGKTTLGYSVYQNLFHKGFKTTWLPGTARECPFPINQDATLNTQNWILHAGITRELEFTNWEGIVVCDRSILDAYCYTVNLFGRQKYLEPLIKEHMKSYDILVFMPLWRFPDYDGVRSVNAQFQKSIHEQFDGMIKLFQLKPMILFKEDSDKWIDRVTNITISYARGKWGNSLELDC